jgi:hypothetical protein
MVTPSTQRNQVILKNVCYRLLHTGPNTMNPESEFYKIEKKKKKKRKFTLHNIHPVSPL